jgi:hypothetical protein
MDTTADANAAAAKSNEEKLEQVRQVFRMITYEKKSLLDYNI